MAWSLLRQLAAVCRPISALGGTQQHPAPQLNTHGCGPASSHVAPCRRCPPTGRTHTLLKRVRVVPGLDDFGLHRLRTHARLAAPSSSAPRSEHARGEAAPRSGRDAHAAIELQLYLSVQHLGQGVPFNGIWRGRGGFAAQQQAVVHTNSPPPPRRAVHGYSSAQMQMPARCHAHCASWPQKSAAAARPPPAGRTRVLCGLPWTARRWCERRASNARRERPLERPHVTPAWQWTLLTGRSGSGAARCAC